jgi:hypothetical protein
LTEYRFALLTIGKDKSRNNLVPIEDLGKFYTEGDEDALISVFRYGREALLYFQKNRTLTGYRGSMWIDYFPFDIDSSSIEESCEKTKKLLRDLREKGIYLYKISCSGKKGFHVIINPAYFGGFEASEMLPEQLLSLARQLTNVDFDRAIYKNLGLFRLNNSKHPVSGFYKVQIKEEDLDNPETIKELIKSPQKPFRIVDPPFVKELEDLKNKSFSYIPKQIFHFSENKKKKLCMSSLMQGARDHEKNESLCRLAYYLKEQGLSKELAYEALSAWNMKNPMKDGFDSSFNSIWEGNYSFGCYDWLLDSNCSKECYLYSQKNSKFSVTGNDLEFFTLFDGQKEYDRFVKEDRWITLGFSEQIDKMIRGLVPGDVCTIIGRPGTLKSTLAQHIGTHVVQRYGVYTLFVSLEMSLTRCYERHMQVLTGYNSQYILDNYMNLDIDNRMEKFLISTKAGVSVPMLETAIKNWQDRTGNRIELVMIDFLHAIKSSGKTDNAIIEVVRQLKDFPKNLDTRLIYLSHTSRGMSKEDKTYLPLKKGDAKDTSEIENNTDFLFGLHKIRDDPEALVVQMLKSKNSEDLESGIILRRQNNSLQYKEEAGIYLPVDDTPF